MGLAEVHEKHPQVVMSTIIGAIVIILIVIAVQVMPSRAKNLAAQAYFTTDDGRTWFADDSTKIAPFDHNGQQAVRCYVFKTADGTKAVYLEKYSDKGKAALAQAAASSGGTTAAGGLDLLAHNEELVKRPSDSQWTNIANPAAAQIMTVGPDDVPVVP